MAVEKRPFVSAAFDFGRKEEGRRERQEEAAVCRRQAAEVSVPQARMAGRFYWGKEKELISSLSKARENGK